ncbi:MAG: DUF814 domain-containing protein [Cyclobacteriaceae bacterium]
MFHNYFFLKRLAEQLNPSLVGKELLECFSQNKDELILGFADKDNELFIKATLESQVCLLHFSHEFKRAKKNSINLFDKIIGNRVISLKCFSYERSFSIQFTNNWQLVFKMHASRSNILLAENDVVLEIFKNSLPNDRKIIPSQLNKPNLSYEHLLENEGEPRKVLPALGKEVNQQLQIDQYENLGIEEKWKYLNTLIDSLNTNPISLTIGKKGTPELSLLENQPTNSWSTQNAIEASSKLHTDFTRILYLESGKSELLKSIVKKIKQSQNYLQKTSLKLEEVKTQRSYEEIANIIMANLHNFESNRLEVELEDFYTSSKITIKRKPNLTPQKQAEQLYRKSKNQKIEIESLEQNIKNRSKALAELESKKNEIEEIEDFKVFKNLKKDRKRDDDTSPLILPYHKFHFKEFDILVGKNASSNDELTTRVAKKNDLWLHAKDVSGSHVVIQNPNGKTVPSDVLERAAELAAWFSKRKKDSICPVIYTEKKYVRKLKGAPKGAVRVDRESVILVVPNK